MKNCAVRAMRVVLTGFKVSGSLDSYPGHSSVRQLVELCVPATIFRLTLSEGQLTGCLLYTSLEHQFHVYQPSNGSYSFSYKAFDAFLAREGLDGIWRRTPGDRLACLKDDYLKEMADTFPRLAPLRALRKTLSGLNTLQPPVGADGRNRSSIRAFAAKTSRNPVSYTHLDVYKRQS